MCIRKFGSGRCPPECTGRRRRWPRRGRTAARARPLPARPPPTPSVCRPRSGRPQPASSAPRDHCSSGHRARCHRKDTSSLRRSPWSVPTSCRVELVPSWLQGPPRARCRWHNFVRPVPPELARLDGFRKMFCSNSTSVVSRQSTTSHRKTVQQRSFPLQTGRVQCHKPQMWQHTLGEGAPWDAQGPTQTPFRRRWHPLVSETSKGHRSNVRGLRHQKDTWCPVASLW
mmetsp:Transcript_16230/g.26385  ORF Transcript_16230/g.26385 Transcript_16230/m.26385 type:complete len:228 (-) Transcript_16230:53-736(-)